MNSILIRALVAALTLPVSALAATSANVTVGTGPTIGNASLVNTTTNLTPNTTTMVTPSTTPPAANTTVAGNTTAAAPRAGRRGQAGPPPGPMPPTIAENATVEKLATLTGPVTPFTEGATVAPNGDVYFVEQNNNKIMKWDVTKKELSVFMEPSGRSNGQYFDAKGNLIACADEKNELWSISLTEKENYLAPGSNATLSRPAHTVLVKEYQGKILNAPNDVWVRPDGGMYITDPFYDRTWWEHHTQPQDTRGVYFLTPDRKTLTRVIGDFNTPNGIIGTPDGKTLYVADINANVTYGYDIQTDGTLANKRRICGFGSDGMTLDDKGNLYLSANRGGSRGVTVVDTKTGLEIGFIPVPEQPANMCFGGKDHQTLYITARTGFYAIPMKVKGANPAK